MRRSAAWIVLGGALGILGCSSATAPSLQPLPDTTPTGVVVLVPDTTGTSAAAPTSQQRAHSNSERFAGVPSGNTAPQPAPPQVRVEPPIGVTVMRLVKDDSAQFGAVPPDVASSSAVRQNAQLSGSAADASAAANVIAGGSVQAVDSGNEGTAHSSTASESAASAAPASGDTNAAAGSADSSADAPGDSVALGAGAPGAATDASAKTANGTQISFAIGDAHAPDEADTQGTSGATPSPQCEVQILHEKPKSPAREVATFKLDAMPAEHADIISLLKRRACEAGANAVLIKKLKQGAAALSADHVEAVALVLESAKPAGHKPVPKTIEVPLPSKPVPKTITVDPDAAH